MKGGIIKRYKKETLLALINREAHFLKKYQEAHEDTIKYTEAILANKRKDYGKAVENRIIKG